MDEDEVHVHGEEAAEGDGDEWHGGKMLVLLIQVDETLIQKEATNNSKDNADIDPQVGISGTLMMHLDTIKEIQTIPKNPVDSVLTWLTLMPWDQHEESENESDTKLGWDMTFLVKGQWDPMIIK